MRAAPAAMATKGSKVRVYSSGSSPPAGYGVRRPVGMWVCSGKKSDSKPRLSSSRARTSGRMDKSVGNIVTPISMHPSLKARRARYPRRLRHDGAAMKLPCYRHEDRLTGASCTRCGRPICGDCMIQAPVGHHCPTCVHEGNKGVRQVKQVRWSPMGSRSQLTPVVTALIGLNVVVYLISQFRPSVVVRYGQFPIGIALNHQYERLLTAAFLHANILHIGSNMLALVIVGPALETALGRVRFAGLYLLAALGGSVCSYLFSNPHDLGVGASGAIFGLFGAYFVVARRHHAETTSIVGLIVINLIFSFAVPLIDWRAHIGGLVVGTAVAAGLTLAETRPPAQRRAIEIGVAAATLAVLIVLIQVRTGQLRSTFG